MVNVVRGTIEPNVKAKAARATDELANQHNARGARSLFGRRLGIFLVTANTVVCPEWH